MGGAIEVARLVPKQIHGRKGSVGSSLKAVKDGLFAAAIHLEHHSAAGSAASAEVAAVESGTVEVARPVANYAPQGVFPVRAGTGKLGEYGITRRFRRFLFLRSHRNGRREKHRPHRDASAGTGSVESVELYRTLQVC